MAESAPAPATIEIKDAMFCTHFKEVSSLARSVRAVPSPGTRTTPSSASTQSTAGVSRPAMVNKDGVYPRKKHASTAWEKRETPQNQNKSEVVSPHVSDANNLEKRLQKRRQKRP
ncbi:hypothetical protein B0H13DRAFT_1901285 [Mycena leptocephala]|nr:hypothetical protein B0H13DRAFT_1901285 [Mycena leptocephala]